ncbi:unnamed protein product [Auanema sp. JU1783]|nr:unnamed protein product [Auanema sp. JU1783]
MEGVRWLLCIAKGGVDALQGAPLQITSIVPRVDSSIRQSIRFIATLQSEARLQSLRQPRLLLRNPEACQEFKSSHSNSVIRSMDVITCGLRCSPCFLVVLGALQLDKSSRFEK